MFHPFVRKRPFGTGLITEYEICQTQLIDNCMCEDELMVELTDQSCSDIQD